MYITLLQKEIKKSIMLLKLEEFYVKLIANDITFLYCFFTMVNESNNYEFIWNNIILKCEIFCELFYFQTLYLYIFDDNEPDISEHIGRVSIPLHPLVTNNPVKGIYELLKVNFFIL